MFHTCRPAASILGIVRNDTAHLIVGSLAAPQGGEEDLSTAAPVCLGDLLLLILTAVWETLRQLLLPAQPKVLGRVEMLKRMPDLPGSS